MKILVTGGSGFIGSALIRLLIGESDHQVVNIDKLTYAANPAALAEVQDNPRYRFYRADICDRVQIRELIQSEKPDVIFHLAAESHVDRSIDSPSEFIQTNIIGTYTLLELAADYFQSQPAEKKQGFRFIHISTDEVYGDLPEGGKFTEQNAYKPSSPYSASKASADHLVRAWHRTYQLPIIITNCSNNFGPYQHPEKLIPKTITNALAGKPIPIYGSGKQVRDWLHVEDHACALKLVMEKGTIGETYNIGSNNEMQNIEVVTTICQILDQMIPKKPNHISSFAELITKVADRAGHDFRYAIDATKLQSQLGWQPTEGFKDKLNRLCIDSGAMYNTA
ncbi:dTDP-glucose 4,6-dehydratase [Persicirhabdus sediminis]|uniref:dTDP-glucose 4,6-dehydratase n=1 Tax=Persicirhabdus sediminis TaxID=454144 RepID=A0A8J7MBQ4_9BACT|nr:dTDP-glucose 4,6-dehydratase [Persicirhabdus sediminis]MBK1790517.1 dTDP-glucose 4,6-dehydratase [Persicirhabdus sediminis]